ncbi:hypothetical protein HN51_052008 [Arachis hypogaea]|uniref:Gibberellin-regulated protein n=1 Tax=Arachis hypogaea TaxID=3818 RepID=A0A445CCH9_ARAHY|nr:gibberellin-regulated protein 11-like [Arachis ipaensis]XP_025612315.1 gibberellin-regulated protein 11 [Arachis hypogaea]XP_025667231.1 gibberellin-regulated protein 11 [Arachis hypogaea]XP_057731639.1 gibberellin-regulated protein 11-like [Arachis stenosperma]QHN93261.1 Gibberellin-regulated protein [Arachis hypogaea]QHO29387.1 Gibberellin-regulated protein [Arachis hypogaea]RYR41247.1 hypothetical protein Ahy_A08g037648 [Arachis hypogaea]RYR48638.1 hypothetical protein Ahy_A07g034689 [
MALSKLLAASLILSFLLLQLSVDAADKSEVPTVEGAVPGPKIDCKGKCDFRCSKSSHPNLCKRSCNTCCQRCNCVPPGTSGNYETCPCYYAQTTHGGKRKCP